MKAYTYILLCCNGQYYVGSTKNLEKRINEHQMGFGSNFTKKHLPIN
ncbi:GIY-YIG nuclease family protein [Shivajiella indica]|uniref:GIY-YIG nuclease family protein n=1 Tax=Shivajiella indica TaxID=872115 RepID=A0ABW5B6Q8_9BACT